MKKLILLGSLLFVLLCATFPTIAQPEMFTDAQLGIVLLNVDLSTRLRNFLVNANIPVIREEVETVNAEAAYTVGERYNAAIVLWQPEENVYRVEVLRGAPYPAQGIGGTDYRFRREMALDLNSFSLAVNTDDYNTVQYLGIMLHGQRSYLNWEFSAANAAFSFAQQYFHTGAIHDFKRGVALYMLASYVRYTQGQTAALELPEVATVADFFSAAIEAQPDFALAYFNRALAWHYVNGATGQAMRDDLNSAIEHDPALAEAYYHLGLDHYGNGEPDDAIADFSTAIELKPDYAFAYFQRGLVYFDRGLDDLRNADMDRAYALWATDIQVVDWPQTFTVRGGRWRGRIDVIGGQVHLRVGAEAGTVIMVQASGFDTIMVVRDPQGQPFAYNDDYFGEFAAKFDALVLPEEGVYTIIVAGLLGTMRGDLTINIEVIEGRLFWTG